MHLLYARFWTKVLADAGLIDFREPFPRLRSQGILHAADGKRMSKSRGNVVTPDAVVERYGADVLRIYLLFLAPFDHNVNWDEAGIAGAQRFLERVWRLALPADGRAAPRSGDEEDGLRRSTHKTIRRVTEDVEGLKFNTAVAALMEWTNRLAAYVEEHGPTPAFQEAVDVLIRLLAPLAPHIAEDLWAQRGGPYSVHQQPWPVYDPELAIDRVVTLIVQVNGRVRDRIAVPAGLADDEARRLALSSPRVQAHLEGRSPEQVVVVPGRLVNVVL
jgi:leucyl-tRNA synthetase